MNGGEKRRRICTALIVLTLAVIWGNSLLPAEQSVKLSNAVAELLGKLAGLLPGEHTGGRGLLRKAAHFAEFACFGVLLAWWFSMRGKTGRDLITRTLLGGFITACVDETIQIFVIGRGSGLIDVWIDACGVVAGLGILLIGQYFIKKKKT